MNASSVGGPSEFWEVASTWFPSATSTLTSLIVGEDKGTSVEADLDRLDLLPTKDREAMLHYRKRAETSIPNAEVGEVEQGLSRLRNWGVSVKWPESDGDESKCWGDVSPRWKRLGFQSADPRRDFRTGMLALENLIYFCEQHPDMAEQLFVEARSKTMDYPLVVASINLTQALAWYLSILPGPCPLGTSHSIQPLDDQMQLHAFARLSVDHDAFGELHSMALICAHLAWKEKKTKDPSVTVVVFGDCMQESLVRVDHVVRNSPLESLLEFRSIGVAGL